MKKRKLGKSFIIVIVAGVVMLINCIGLVITKSDFFVGAWLISMIVYAITVGVWLGLHHTFL